MQNICVYGASSGALDEAYYRAGYLLGEELAKAGYGLVFGGGNMGIMGATARGARKAGGNVIGVIPKFMADIDGLAYPDADEIIVTDTMRERKMKMEELSEGFITAPGGLGTFEEFFEILTLRQLKQHKKALIVLNTEAYYDPMITMLEHCTAEKFASKSVLDLFMVAGTPKEAVKMLKNYEYVEFADKWHHINELKNA